MFTVIGIVIVFGAVIGGYLMEHGNLKVLFQPAELVIIGGAAFGTLFIANPLPVVIAIFKACLSPFLPARFSKQTYLETLRMLNELFAFSRKNGLVQLEVHIEDPQKSALFAKYPHFLKNHHAVHFVCDTLRMSVSGGVSPYELEQVMEFDIEVHHHELSVPVAALTTVADSLPGLGIVAAVLGVVITMGALGGPPEEIGHKVAAALVGTFLGILLCYGLLGPLASYIAKLNEKESQYYHTLRTGVIAFAKGNAPIMAVEFARRAIPHDLRPTFKEMEGACRGGGAPQPQAA
jgi:chemotaxis protein MotA